MDILYNSFSYRLQACNFIKKKIQHRYFPVNFAKKFKNIFFTEHLWTTAPNIYRLTIFIDLDLSIFD